MSRMGMFGLVVLLCLVGVGVGDDMRLEFVGMKEATRSHEIVQEHYYQEKRSRVFQSLVHP